MRLVLALLHLLAPSGGAPLSLAAFAGAPHWRLLDEPHAVEEVFCVALTLVDFLHFHEVRGGGCLAHVYVCAVCPES